MKITIHQTYRQRWRQRHWLNAFRLLHSLLSTEQTLVCVCLSVSVCMRERRKKSPRIIRDINVWNVLSTLKNRKKWLSTFKKKNVMPSSYTYARILHGFYLSVEIFIMSKYWHGDEENTSCFNHLFVFICSLTYHRNSNLILTIFLEFVFFFFCSFRVVVVIVFDFTLYFLFSAISFWSVIFLVCQIAPTIFVVHFGCDYVSVCVRTFGYARWSFPPIEI